MSLTVLLTQESYESPFVTFQLTKQVPFDTISHLSRFICSESWCMLRAYFLPKTALPQCLFNDNFYFKLFLNSVCPFSRLYILRNTWVTCCQISSTHQSQAGSLKSVHILSLRIELRDKSFIFFFPLFKFILISEHATVHLFVQPLAEELSCAKPFCWMPETELKKHGLHNWVNKKGHD